MKKIILMVILSLSVYLTNAQRKDVTIKDIPQAVANSFTNAYHSVKTEWRKVGNDFEAAFEDNGTRTYVVYDNNGKLVRKEVTIKSETLPSGSIEYIKTTYGNNEVKQVRKITDASGKVIYRATVKESRLYFDDNGKFIRTEKIEVDED